MEPYAIIFIVGIIVFPIWTIIERFVMKKRSKQTCFVYCPGCHKDLVSSDSFVEDKDGIVKYKCDKCGNISFWDFIHYPIPYLRTCADNCKHFYMDKTGHDYGCFLEKECNPDIMVKFEPRMHGKEEE